MIIKQLFTKITHVSEISVEKSNFFQQQFKSKSFQKRLKNLTNKADSVLESGSLQMMVEKMDLK